ncbi:MAG TPA: tetratricopeptide repeat protein [Candidatus Brocadiia bacterium]|nr:tetratricopeptide repeat protein [Candidatus Brocadiia bacterium]
MKKGAASSFAKSLAMPILIIGAVWLMFGRAIGYDFVNWDDPVFTYQSPLVSGRSENPLREAFTTASAGYYAPILWLTLRGCYRLWGADPAGYHALNVALHSLNAALVYVLLRRLGAGRMSFPAALLWALHPARAESVAWITEIKDVLSGFFCLAGAIAVIDSCNDFLYRRGGIRNRGFIAGVLLMILGFGAKPTVVVWPMSALLLVVFAPRLAKYKGRKDETIDESDSQRFRRLAIYFVPVVLIACAFAIQFHAVQSRAGVTRQGLEATAAQRFLLASASIRFHLEKTFMPVDLCPCYPRPVNVGFGNPGFADAVVVSLAILCAAAVFWKRKPWLTVALGFFVITMLPMLQIIPTAIAFADRYTYLASILLFAWMAVETDSLATRLCGNAAGKISAAFLAAAIAAESLLAAPSLEVWRDSASLWSSVIAWHENGAIGSRWKRNSDTAEILLKARINYATALHRAGRLAEAETFYRDALRQFPDSRPLYMGLARALIDKGELVESENLLRYVSARWTDNPIADFELMRLYLKKDDWQSAEAVLPRAIMIPGWNPPVFHFWGQEFMRLGRPIAAIACFERCVRDCPGDPDFRLAHAEACLAAGRQSDARASLEKCLNLDGGNERAKAILGRITSGQR